jgi:hypothetical protein
VIAVDRAPQEVPLGGAISLLFATLRAILARRPGLAALFRPHVSSSGNKSRIAADFVLQTVRHNDLAAPAPQGWSALVIVGKGGENFDIAAPSGVIVDELLNESINHADLLNGKQVGTYLMSTV